MLDHYFMKASEDAQMHVRTTTRDYAMPIQLGKSRVRVLMTVWHYFLCLKHPI